MVNGLKPVEITLPEVPSTGYAWKADLIGDVELLKDELVVPPLESDEYCGTLCSHVFQFQPTSQVYVIYLTHFRPWDSTSVTQELIIRGMDYE